MTQTSEHLTEAYSLHEAGRLADAADCYRRHLDTEPEHADALDRLGALYSLQGRHDEAAKCYRRLISLLPENAGPHFNLGNALQAQGNTEEAEHWYRKAVGIDPHHGPSMVNLGSLLMQSARLPEAKKVLKMAVEAAPELAEAHSNLGATLLSLGDPSSALQYLEKARSLKPDDIGAQANLGMAMQELGNPQGALELYDETLRVVPNNVVIRSARATALCDLDRLDEALLAFDDVVDSNASYAQGHSNRATALQGLGRIEEALVAHETAVTLAPGNPDIRWNRAQTLLSSGDFENGWAEFEWRLKCRRAMQSRHPAPRWDGAEIDGKTILLTLERGLGDTIQFCRLAGALKDRGARVALECQAPLVRLLHSNKDIDAFVTPGDISVACDVQLPLVSLPGMLSLNADTIPGDVPYLTPPASSLKRTGAVIEAREGHRIGICWAGSPHHTNDRRRSCPPALMSRLAEVPNAALFSLQKEVSSADSQWLENNPDIVDLAPICYDFADTAAAITALDLVISVDTSVAHLAGALGCPVWTLLPFAPDWRWGTGTQATPWYPTMRLFRQPAPGDWESVFDAIAHALGGLTARENHRPVSTS